MAHSVLGPTGVGKTELAKTLAEALFDSEDNVIRIDMRSTWSGTRCRGSWGRPPGTWATRRGGQLTEAVRRKPHSVLLFDEIEKAHHDVFNVLLQILDDGRATDSQGHVVDFKNTVIIMTSNIGSHYLLEGISPAGEISHQARESVMAELRSSFRPEFLNRVDEIVLFKPLRMDEIKQIVGLLVAELQHRLADRGITLDLTDEARTLIAERGFDPVYGARPLKRYLQRELETKVGRALVGGEVGEGARLRVSVKDGGLEVVGG